MDQLSAMRVYVAVVEAQGFSAASRSLKMPLPTVSRKIAELEESLGAQLLVRTTRRVTVTDSGERYYDDIKPILEDIDNAGRQASGEYRTAKGLLTITAPSLFGRLHVLPIVHEFMAAHDEIEVRLLFTNTLLDLQEERIDLAIRIGPPALAGAMEFMTAGIVRQIVCASPDYFSAKGRPTSPTEIVPHHHCITFSRTGGYTPWDFKLPSGRPRQIVVKSRLRLNSVAAAVESALRGLGLVQLYSYQAANQLASRELVLVLEKFESDPQPVNLMFPHGRRVPRKVNEFIEFALPALEERLLNVARLCDD